MGQKGHRTPATIVSRVRHLAAEGYSRRQIARELNISRGVVERVQANPEFAGEPRDVWRCRGCGGLMRPKVEACRLCGLDRNGERRKLLTITGATS